MTKRDEKKLVPAIERTVQIMDLLTDSSRALGVSEIARSLGLAKSSVHGICETLSSLGLLQSDPLGYTLGRSSLRWSSAYLARNSIVQDFQSVLSTDPRLSGFTVTLSTLDGPNVVYLDCHNSDRPLGFTFQTGLRLPAIYTATGKAMLAALPPQEWPNHIGHEWPTAFTPDGVKDFTQLTAQLECFKAQGFAVDKGEIRAGMVCLGAAVLDRHGRPLAGIALSLTEAEARDELRAEIGAMVAETARRLSR